MRYRRHASYLESPGPSKGLPSFRFCSPMSGKAYLLLVLLCLIAAGCGRSERMDALYAQRCIGCHGATGKGEGQTAAALSVRVPEFRETVERRSNGQIRKIIAEGRGMMPAFDPALKPGEINDMVRMVRFLSREGREVSWWEKYDTLIAAHCSVPWEAVFGYDEPLEAPQEPQAR